MKILKVYIFIFFLSALAIMAVLTSDVLDQEDQSSEDSAALFGGEIESGYPTGGYLVSENTSGKYNYCSIVNIRRGMAITAAHCVEDTISLEIGFNTFIFEGDNNLQVERVYRSNKWDGNNLNADFAVIEYSLNNEQARPNAQIVEPEVGCNYRVVAYGRTEEDEVSQLETRPRKSAAVCIEEVNEGTFSIESIDGGICLGDSGSPIYINNSDIVVGVVSSIIAPAESRNDPCFIGNKAIAVRADINYENFDQIDSSSALSEFDSQDITEASGLFDDFIDATGTKNLFSSRENILYFALGVIAVFTLVMILTKTLNRIR